ncbi:hypothetical protein [Phaeobacter sp. SYSU ZJ3003]|uniref:hypothetical protein n=1 Tax=Phaeobacter sp. SYSU ZJ3003 TaxID=2109330 RepID=UPI00351C01A2
MLERVNMPTAALTQAGRACTIWPGHDRPADFHSARFDRGAEQTNPGLPGH